MSFSTRSFIACLAALTHSCIAGYALQDDYTPSNFFSQFSFDTAPDTSGGIVSYVDQSTAQSLGMISQNADSVQWGVDTTTNGAYSGRQSIRLVSNKVYSSGLIVLDLAHMPTGCGTWPAFWMVGPNWPSSGEIDIIEGVNMATTNAMTLHTGPGCSISNNGAFTGDITTSNCYVYEDGNAGCSINSTNPQSYGAGLNAISGGVYATEWTSDGISIWFFPRSGIPSDLTSGNPDPTSWGRPAASFQDTSCDISTAVQNQQIVFDTDFCGPWADGLWGECASQGSSCQAFVANNPSAFTNAYWKINSLKVYSANGDVSQPAPVGHGHRHHHAGGGGVNSVIPSSLAPWVPPSLAPSSPATSTFAPAWSTPSSEYSAPAWSTPSSEYSAPAATSTPFAPAVATTQNSYTTLLTSTTAAVSTTPISQWGSWTTPVVDGASTPTPISQWGSWTTPVADSIPTSTSSVVAVEAASYAPSVSVADVTSASIPATTAAAASAVDTCTDEIPSASAAVEARGHVRRHARHILKHKRAAGHGI